MKWLVCISILVCCSCSSQRTSKPAAVSPDTTDAKEVGTMKVRRYPNQQYKIEKPQAPTRQRLD